MSVLREPIVSDLPGMYRVCLETAEPHVNPDLLGHVYAGPYVVAQPAFARVVADTSGVSGYIVGCPDTRAFEAWCADSWWPALRAQYPLGSGADLDAGLTRLLHDPPRSPDDVVSGHPAHLHINILASAQRRGHGRALIDWLCAELVEHGVTGVHLGVDPANSNAIGFYHHLGLPVLLERDGTLWMGKSLR